MLTFDQYKAGAARMRSILPMRLGSETDEAMRDLEYSRLLIDLHPSDFDQACDRIAYDDEWYPTVARIREVAAECLRERMARYDAQQQQAAAQLASLVCATCHGARWVRLGGASGMRDHDRLRACPDCTTDNRYDYGKERHNIQQHGGVPGDNDQQPDMTRSDWRAPRTADGRIDMDALYRESRILRGLDPDIDERPAGVRGFLTPADVLAPR